MLAPVLGRPGFPLGGSFGTKPVGRVNVGRERPGLPALADRASTSIMVTEVGKGVHCDVTGMTTGTGGYGQSWCLASSSGLVLGLLNGFAVAEVHALDHLGEALRAVQPAPVPLGGLGELEDHGERGLA